MKKYDLVVIGGGTAGVSGAWNAAITGLTTLLIEKNTFLGGSITSSLVVPAMKTSKNSINNDFFNEFYKKLNEKNGVITYIDGNKGWFNPEIAKIILDEILISAGVDILFEHHITSINKTKDEILSISIESVNNNNIYCKEIEMLLAPIEAINFVDATGDANFCQKLNCNFLNKNKKETQPRNLRFIMSGVDRFKFGEWLLAYDTNRDVSTAAIINGSMHFSTAYTWDNSIEWALKPLFKEAIANNILKEEDSNYFQIFSMAGTIDSVVFNCPRLIKENSNPYLDGRAAIYRISDFCKKYLPGFEKAQISNIANSLGVRVSNLVEGEYVYTYEDLISGKTFEHPVLISNYPVDIHSDDKDKSILKKVYKEYQLPLESLFVKGYKNLFVIGRCLSAEFKAQAALRIIPSCFSMGEGLAKHLSTRK